MVCDPTGMLLVFRVAVPAETGTEPSVVAPLVKVTVPVGELPVTVAVSATL